ncbi:MAG: hypothetical protein Q8K75_09790 [Chlamydiales bacterium]|nr:hypothetical protein [Chlamydiales bacterium]
MNGMNALYSRWDLLQPHVKRDSFRYENYRVERSLKEDIAKTEGLVENLFAQLDCLTTMVGCLREVKTAMRIDDKSRRLGCISAQQAIFAQSITALQPELDAIEATLAGRECSSALDLRSQRARKVAKQVLIESEMERRPNDPRLDDLRLARDSYKAEALKMEKELLFSHSSTFVHLRNKDMLSAKMDLMLSCLNQFVRLANDVQENSVGIQENVERLFTNFDERCQQTKTMAQTLADNLRKNREYLEVRGLAEKVCDKLFYRPTWGYDLERENSVDVKKWSAATEILEAFVAKDKG